MKDNNIFTNQCRCKDIKHIQEHVQRYRNHSLKNGRGNKIWFLQTYKLE